MSFSLALLLCIVLLQSFVGATQPCTVTLKPKVSGSSQKVYIAPNVYYSVVAHDAQSTGSETWVPLPASDQDLTFPVDFDSNSNQFKIVFATRQNQPNSNGGEDTIYTHGNVATTSFTCTSGAHFDYVLVDTLASVKLVESSITEVTMKYSYSGNYLPAPSTYELPTSQVSDISLLFAVAPANAVSMEFSLSYWNTDNLIPSSTLILDLTPPTLNIADSFNTVNIIKVQRLMDHDLIVYMKPTEASNNPVVVSSTALNDVSSANFEFNLISGLWYSFVLKNSGNDHTIAKDYAQYADDDDIVFQTTRATLDLNGIQQAVNLVCTNVDSSDEVFSHNFDMTSLDLQDFRIPSFDYSCTISWWPSPNTGVSSDFDVDCTATTDASPCHLDATWTCDVSATWDTPAPTVTITTGATGSEEVYLASASTDSEVEFAAIRGSYNVILNYPDSPITLSGINFCAGTNSGEDDLSGLLCELTISSGSAIEGLQVKLSDDTSIMTLGQAELNDMYYDANTQTSVHLDLPNNDYKIRVLSNGVYTDYNSGNTVSPSCATPAATVPTNTVLMGCKLFATVDDALPASVNVPTNPSTWFMLDNDWSVPTLTTEVTALLTTYAFGASCIAISDGAGGYTGVTPGTLAPCPVSVLTATDGSLLVLTTAARLLQVSLLSGAACDPLVPDFIVHDSVRYAPLSSSLAIDAPITSSSNSPLVMPAGWSVCPATEGTIVAISGTRYQFGARNVVLADGNAYDAITGELVIDDTLQLTTTGNFKSAADPRDVILICQAAEVSDSDSFTLTTAVITQIIESGGYDWAVLEDVPVWKPASTVPCLSVPMKIPAGWEIVTLNTDDVETDFVISHWAFGTSYLASTTMAKAFGTTSTSSDDYQRAYSVVSGAETYYFSGSRQAQVMLRRESRYTGLCSVSGTGHTQTFSRARFDYAGYGPVTIFKVEDVDTGKDHNIDIEVQARFDKATLGASTTSGPKVISEVAVKVTSYDSVGSWGQVKITAAGTNTDTQVTLSYTSNTNPSVTTIGPAPFTAEESDHVNFLIVERPGADDTYTIVLTNQAVDDTVYNIWELFRLNLVVRTAGRGKIQTYLVAEELFAPNTGMCGVMTPDAPDYDADVTADLQGTTVTFDGYNAAMGTMYLVTDLADSFFDDVIPSNDVTVRPSVDQTAYDAALVTCGFYGLTDLRLENCAHDIVYLGGDADAIAAEAFEYTYERVDYETEINYPYPMADKPTFTYNFGTNEYAILDTSELTLRNRLGCQGIGMRLPEGWAIAPADALSLSVARVLELSTASICLLDRNTDETPSYYTARGEDLVTMADGSMDIFPTLYDSLFPHSEKVYAITTCPSRVLIYRALGSISDNEEALSDELRLSHDVDSLPTSWWRDGEQVMSDELVALSAADQTAIEGSIGATQAAGTAPTHAIAINANHDFISPFRSLHIPDNVVTTMLPDYDLIFMACVQLSAEFDMPANSQPMNFSFYIDAEYDDYTHDIVYNEYGRIAIFDSHELNWQCREVRIRTSHPSDPTYLNPTDITLWLTVKYDWMPTDGSVTIPDLLFTVGDVTVDSTNYFDDSQLADWYRADNSPMYWEAKSSHFDATAEYAQGDMKVLVNGYSVSDVLTVGQHIHFTEPEAPGLQACGVVLHACMGKNGYRPNVANSNSVLATTLYADVRYTSPLSNEVFSYSFLTRFEDACATLEVPAVNGDGLHATDIYAYVYVLGMNADEVLYLAPDQWTATPHREGCSIAAQNVALSTGDPHMVTVSGHAYDYQLSGDSLLLLAATPAGGAFRAEMRTFSVVSESGAEDAAISVGASFGWADNGGDYIASGVYGHSIKYTSQLSVDVSGSSIVVLFNGQPISHGDAKYLDDEAFVTFTELAVLPPNVEGILSTLSVSPSEGIEITVTISISAHGVMYLDTSVALSDLVLEASNGMCRGVLGTCPITVEQQLDEQDYLEKVLQGEVLLDTPSFMAVHTGAFSVAGTSTGMTSEDARDYCYLELGLSGDPLNDCIFDATLLGKTMSSEAAALIMNNSPFSTSLVPPVQPTPDPEDETAKFPIGAVVGGALAIAAVVGVVLFLRRDKGKKVSSKKKSKKHSSRSRKASLQNSRV
eukprot:gnl/Dysnectes_brevis/436_a479_6267.p1 GENE.gnl/Dysnectes_brevis/436_a479_6267~~gnl/Dysnectes_brevis/436_a479_6267.p1  ORF type:complete len:2106 (-),score=751.98 gnl/Dysnectes_brevis/436_a479_6267:106-6423(-)